MSIELRTNELVRVLKDAQLFAHGDNTIPVINAVHLESRDKELIAVGTDRFVLGVSKTELDEITAPFTAALPLRQVKTILQLAGSCKQAVSKVTLDADEKTVRVAFSSGETLTLPAELETGAHRGWLKLLDSTPDDTPSKAMLLNPALLAKFSRVTGGGQARARLHFFGMAKPIRVTIGDSFVGMVMPCRMPDDASADWSTPDWVKPPPPPAAVEKPAAKKAATPKRTRTPAKKAS